MAVWANRIAVARVRCPAVDPGQGRAPGPPLDHHGGLQIAMVAAAARAATDALPWRTARARPLVWARQRFPAAPAQRNQPAACAARVSRRAATVRPARPGLPPARSPTPPDPSTQALAAGRRHGRSRQIPLQLSDDANVGRSQVSTTRTRTRPARSYLRLVHFPRRPNTSDSVDIRLPRGRSSRGSVARVAAAWSARKVTGDVAMKSTARLRFDRRQVLR